MELLKIVIAICVELSAKYTQQSKQKVIVVITNDMARRALSINDIKAYNPKILEFEGAWRDCGNRG